MMTQISTAVQKILSLLFLEANYRYLFLKTMKPIACIEWESPLHFSKGANKAKFL